MSLQSLEATQEMNPIPPRSMWEIIARRDAHTVLRLRKERSTLRKHVREWEELAETATAKMLNLKHENDALREHIRILELLR